MAIEHRQCATVRCDSCGNGWDNYDFQPHYPDAAAALAGAADAGWRIQNGGQAVCRPCADRADCARHGHQWSDWLHCRCAGSIDLHQAVGCLRFRYCNRCGAGDSEPLVAPA